MTSARKDIVDLTQQGYYHCIARCVRRSFLCGEDSYSGKSFEHRRQWIRDRLTQLIGIFAIECLSYSVMGNHLHSVISNRPDLLNTWTDAEIASRWFKLFPRKKYKDGSLIPTAADIESMTSNTEKVTAYRKRLGDISWFNRCLNEHIARKANREDDCKGRFWEGRFKCQRLDGPAALLAGSIYVDLNPIRAGIAKTPEHSDFTSIQDRIQALTSGEIPTGRPPLVPVSQFLGCDLTEREYLMLVDQAGRKVKDEKQAISPELSPILDRLGLRVDGLIEHLSTMGGIFKRVIAPVQRLGELATMNSKNWFHGKSAAKRLFS